MKSKLKVWWLAPLLKSKGKAESIRGRHMLPDDLSTTHNDSGIQRTLSAESAVLITLI